MTGFQTVSEDELDRALLAGKVEVTRANARPVRCARAGCRRIAGAGQARRLWIDGHARGFLCVSDCWNLGDSNARGTV